MLIFLEENRPTEIAEFRLAYFDVISPNRFNDEFALKSKQVLFFYITYIEERVDLPSPPPPSPLPPSPPPPIR